MDGPISTRPLAGMVRSYELRVTDCCRRGAWFANNVQQMKDDMEALATEIAALRRKFETGDITDLLTPRNAAGTSESPDPMAKLLQGSSLPALARMRGR